MTADTLINLLGYKGAKTFSPIEDAILDAEHAYLFRQAKESSGLRGVYFLREESQTTKESTPVVYIAETTKDDAEADKIHKRVWNQNVVPFLLVALPTHVRVYAGFRYQPDERDNNTRGVIETNVPYEQVTERLKAFSAPFIDDGRLWREQTHNVTPETRVDWKLLGNLEALARKLKGDKLEATPYKLIGKFIYLRYLRDRQILSNDKLKEFGVSYEDIFGRDIKRTKLQKLIKKVDDWLNGSIFPLNLETDKSISDKDIQAVADAFAGDEVATDQMHLGFQAYDFAHLSIETLSNIYESFLALKKKKISTEKDSQGAFYTPLPLVNFVLTEMNNIRPLREHMRVLDPSCGSGAFLVQCYRRLIEQTIAERGGAPLTRPELRTLLTRHIFGVDKDSDACDITKLSLLLTLLSYLKQPDLQDTTFKLPSLEANIFAGDFFDRTSAWHQTTERRRYDWIVGNPPWLKLSQADQCVKDWVKKNKKEQPIVGDRVEEAFAWKSLEHLAEDGAAGLVLPAMCLVEENGDAFRKPFFQQVNLQSVANFANLRRVLFEKAKQPAAAIFFSSMREKTEQPKTNVLSYAPMVLNQTANKPQRSGKQEKIWHISLQYSEVKALRRQQPQEGAGLPWKLAMWGSHRDEQLLSKLEKKFPSLEQFGEAERGWSIVSGPQLRNEEAEDTIWVESLVGEPLLDIKKLRQLKRLHDFPARAIAPIPHKGANILKSGGLKCLEICKGPHIIVSEARTFAVFREDFLVVPPRQIGIAGKKEDTTQLKALALFLNSKFTQYHQFLTASKPGIYTNVSTLRALRQIPTPLGKLTPSELKEWVALHTQLVQTTQKKWPSGAILTETNLIEAIDKEIEALEVILNQKVYKLLGLSPQEQALVEDLVNVKMDLVDGKSGAKATRAPTLTDCKNYETMLATELDSWLEKDSPERHRVVSLVDDSSGFVMIERVKKQASPTEDHPALLARKEKIAQRQRQWIYFERNFFDYDEQYLYFLKPAQYLWWTQSQALSDADQIRAARPDLFLHASTPAAQTSLYLRPTPYQKELFWKEFATTITDDEVVSVSKTYVRAEDVLDVRNRKRPELESLTGDAILFLLDHDPQANWGHPCTYVLFLLQEGKFHTFKHNMPPSIEIDMVELPR